MPDAGRVTRFHMRAIYFGRQIPGFQEIVAFCCPCDRSAYRGYAENAKKNFDNLNSDPTKCDVAHPYIFALDWDAGTLTADDQSWQAPKGREREWSEEVLAQMQAMTAAKRLAPSEIRERAIDILGFRGRRRLTPEEQSRLHDWLKRNSRFCDSRPVFELLSDGPVTLSA